MNRLHFLSVVLVALSLLASACGSASEAPEPNYSAGAPSEAPRAPAAAPAPEAPQDGFGSSGEASTADRMVMYNASLRLVVTDVEQLLSDVAQLARGMGGYVVSSESRESNGNRVGSASIRVPAERLDEALAEIKGMATRVDRSAISSQDVTEEFVDQEARLRTLRATEDQYLTLITTARNVEDTLRVHQSLTQVREQIERTQGRIQYLRGSSEMALISMDVSTAVGARPVDTVGWDAQETLAGALQGLVAIGLLLASLVIWVVVFTPVWVPALLFIRWWRRRRRSPTPAAPVAGAGS